MPWQLGGFGNTLTLMLDAANSCDMMDPMPSSLDHLEWVQLQYPWTGCWKQKMWQRNNLYVMPALELHQEWRYCWACSLYYELVSCLLPQLQQLRSHNQYCSSLLLLHKCSFPADTQLLISHAITNTTIPDVLCMSRTHFHHKNIIPPKLKRLKKKIENLDLITELQFLAHGHFTIWSANIYPAMSHPPN